MNIQKTQRVKARQPRQERARLKVELILEAAMRLLDRGGLALLTTNAIAEVAGISIGTLYQYFPNKDAILDALAEQEMAEMSSRILLALRDSPELSPRARVGLIVSAVASGYGERRQVHRVVLDHSLARGARRTAPLVARVIALLTSRSAVDATGQPMREADAFVLTNAVVGVMRAMIARADDTAPAQVAIEEALARLIISFVDPGPASD